MSNSGKKVWFVTGASSGFGREIVEAALERGDHVVATARNVDSLADLAKRDGVLVLRLDVTKPVEIDVAVREATERFGRVDVLVNNAGFSILGAVEETSEAALRETMETMFFGAVALTRAVIPGMRSRRSGTIVQITSVGGITTAPGFGAYCAAKHALEGLSECMEKELAPHGVHVLLVEPGAFRTSLFGSRFRHLPELDAYAGTVGGLRTWVKATDGSQPGDPKKAAVAIVDAVHSPSMPLRLPLGADAVSGIREKLAFIAADVDRSETIALATAL
jgi:NAD(P)-dependent dehydrogenase (short-subunit alcohol dehydrogenase family)